MAEQQKNVQDQDLNQLRKVRREKTGGSSGAWGGPVSDYQI